MPPQFFIPFFFLLAQGPPAPPPAGPSEPAPAESAATDDATRAAEEKVTAQRTQLNLLGAADTKSGESRRNENVQFNLVDNNAQKELNIRIGITATPVTEFDQARNYFGAEYGEAPSPVLHGAPLTGAGIHGRVFWGHLNSITTARSFFQVGEVQPARENDYGFLLQAPVWRGARWEIEGTQRKIRGQVNGNVLIPLPDERTPLATDPRARAFIQRILDAYPNVLPNRTDIDRRMLNTNAPQTINSDFLRSRLDQDLGGSRGRLIADYQLTLQQVQAFQLIRGQNPDTNTRAHRARLTWVKQTGASGVLEVTTGFDRVRSLLVLEPNNPGPHVFIGGGALTSIAGSTMLPVDRAQNEFRNGVRYRRTAGRHEFRLGFDLMRRQLNGRDSDNHNDFGTWAFRNNFGLDAIEALRHGLATTFWQSFGLIHRGFRTWDLAGYAGDRWQVTPRLTLDYGLRWRASTAPTEVNGLTNLPYRSDWNNLGPTLGLAFRLPDRWGVFRAGAALQYGEIFPASYQQSRFNQPYNIKNIVNDPDLLNPLGSIVGTPRGVLYDFAPELVSPYVGQYTAVWELTPARGWTVRAAYVGSRGVKLLTHWYFNRAHWAAGEIPNTGMINEVRPNSEFLDMRRLVNGSMSWYDAGRLTVTSSRWRGMNLELSYWLSKSRDLGGDYTNTAYDVDSFRNASQTEENVHGDLRALSRFDQPHAFLARVNAELPALRRAPRAARLLLGGWTASSVVLVKSGTPFTVGTGSDAPGFGNVDGIGGDRPNVVDPSILGRTIGNPDTSRARLPRSAFAYLPIGADRGNLGRYTFRRGGIYNVNAGLLRQWILPGDARLQFRADSVNFLNTPQFAEPGANMTDPNFGAITNTLNEGRNFRFNLAFLW
ncbi:MAG: hypothetical protein M9913_08395 [Bryobacteraceae bacterium]|nr:hypothetical protein [Solibacteraceae bacterium]MCO5350903.1 hypothetical protein [Bryobacteraceae bacterium]